jgi:hypothetical protein
MTSLQFGLIPERGNDRLAAPPAAPLAERRGLEFGQRAGISFALMPTDGRPLSDTSAVRRLDFLNELVPRFDSHYDGQIHRLLEHECDFVVNPLI